MLLFSSFGSLSGSEALSRRFPSSSGPLVGLMRNKRDKCYLTDETDATGATGAADRGKMVVVDGQTAGTSFKFPLPLSPRRPRRRHPAPYRVSFLVPLTSNGVDD